MIPAVAPQSLRIVSYNIRKAMGTDRRRDPERIMRIIRSLHADVVVLQEADRRRAPRPSALPLDRVEEVTGLRPVPTPSDVSIGWHGNAVLVRPSAKIDRVAHLTLPGVEPRGAMVADLHLGADGDPMTIAGRIVEAAPTGSYARRIWFLYEWLLGEALDLPDATRGNYAPMVDTRLQWDAEGAPSPRHRVRNNLPGTPDFCPMIFRTPAIEAFIARDLAAE